MKLCGVERVKQGFFCNENSKYYLGEPHMAYMYLICFTWLLFSNDIAHHIKIYQTLEPWAEVGQIQFIVYL